MITAADFEMIETIAPDVLERHPVWSPYEAAVDRERLIAEGVAGSAVDRAYARFEFCGLQPLYPVLSLDPLPDLPHLIVAAAFESADGRALSGYLLEPHAFGIFVSKRDFCFNRNLPTLAPRIGTALGAALGVAPERLFPLRFTTGLQRNDGTAIEGDLDRPW